MKKSIEEYHNLQFVNNLHIAIVFLVNIMGSEDRTQVRRKETVKMTKNQLDVNKLNAALSRILSKRAGHRVSVQIEKGGTQNDCAGKHLDRSQPRHAG